MVSNYVLCLISDCLDKNMSNQEIIKLLTSRYKLNEIQSSLNLARSLLTNNRLRRKGTNHEHKSVAVIEGCGKLPHPSPIVMQPLVTSVQLLL